MSRLCNGILAAKWTYLQSTKNLTIEMTQVEKRWKNNNSPVTKPNIVLEYNDSIGGMDLQDC